MWCAPVPLLRVSPGPKYGFSDHAAGFDAPMGLCHGGPGRRTIGGEYGTSGHLGGLDGRMIDALYPVCKRARSSKASQALIDTGAPAPKVVKSWLAGFWASKFSFTTAYSE